MTTTYSKRERQANTPVMWELRKSVNKSVPSYMQGIGATDNIWVM